MENKNNNNIYIDDYMITTPINVARLENKKMKKILYLFFDYHVDANMQTECGDVNSIYLTQFFDKIFRKTKIPLDFFFEIQPKDDELRNMSRTNDKYIWKMHNIFIKKYDNVRNHYIDIRHLLTFNPYTINFDIKDIIHNNYTDDTKYDLLIDKIKKYMKEYNDLKTINLTGNESNIDTNMVKYFRKINKYTKKPENTTKFNIFYDEIEKLTNIAVTSSKKIIKLLENLRNELNKDTKILLGSDGAYHFGDFDKITKIKSDINGESQTMTNGYLHASTLLVDLYFLRRFLEKSYINNAIVYAGAAHIVNYIYFLITRCGFELTNLFYTKEGTLEKTIEFVNSMKNDANLLDNFENDSINNKLLNIFEPPIFSQCINFKGFPKYFR